MCTADVKVELFRTFCIPLYTVQIWWNCRLYGIRKLNVGYNDIMRLLLHLPRYHSLLYFLFMYPIWTTLCKIMLSLK